MDDVDGIFARYEAVRARLPAADFVGAPRSAASLEAVAPEVDAFVFDAFGVLNVGDTPIPGAAARLAALRAGGHAIRVLSNAASAPHAATVAKLRRLGMDVAPEEVVTSRDAALAALDDRLWGCVAAPGDDLSDVPGRAVRVTDRTGFDAVEGVLILSSADWDDARQAALAASLVANPRPVVVANADLAAPREGAFSREPGFYGHLLADAGVAVRFFGKPFAEVFAMVEATLPGVAPDRIAMCGDTLHTDILGAAARGWRTVLVERDGMFAGAEAGGYAARAGIVPTWRVPRI